MPTIDAPSGEAELEARVTTQIAAGIAQDLLQHLAGVEGCLDQSASRVRDSRTAEGLRRARRHLEKAKALGGRLLSMSRRGVEEASVFSVHDLAEEVAQGFKLRHDGRLAITLRKEASVHEVNGYPGTMRFALRLLLEAEARVAPEGASLLLSTSDNVVDGSHLPESPWSRAGRYVRIEIAGKGPPVTRAFLDRYFEPCLSERPDRPREGPALSLVCAIVKQHRGYVYVASQPGEPAIYRIDLPLSNGAVPGTP